MPVSGRPQNAKPAPEFQVSIFHIMLFQASALILRSFIQVRMVDAGYDPVAASHLSAIAGFAVLAILMWPLMVKSWPIVREQFRRPASWSRMVLASAALGFVLWLGQMLALLAISPLDWLADGPYTFPTSPSYTFSCINSMILPLAIPVMSLMTPVIEEIVNRGLILRILLPRGKTTAVLLSATLFAVLHKPATIPFAFVFGVFVAIQMLHYQSLWAVIITHSVANLLVELSITCIDGFWLPGKIIWAAGSPALSIALAFIACIVTASWLATTRSAGAVDPAPATDISD